MMRLAVVGVVLVVVAVSVGWVFQPGGAPRTPAQTPGDGAREQFAADRDGGFDAGQAMTYLEGLCKIGPRVSGSPSMKKQQELLRKHFEAQGARVKLQTFTARQQSRPQPTEMANLIASWHPERKRRVILCSHYDTRPIADQERDRRKWTEPFLSANDGTSGVALLMELARHVKGLRTDVGIDFVLFDGEEYIYDPRPEPDGDHYFFGSEYFARAYGQQKPKERYVAAVLLDMIAGKNARFPVERYSWLKAPELVQEIWRVAAELKCTAFQDDWGVEVRDDHVALNRAGIPTVDVIDFDYPHWHRLTDLPENCSADSMLQVAKVLVAWVQRAR